MIDHTITMVTRWWRGELLAVTNRTRLRMLIDKAEVTDRYFWRRRPINLLGMPTSKGTTFTITVCDTHASSPLPIRQP
jgi:hypothetical protein